jgi:integrase
VGELEALVKSQSAQIAQLTDTLSRIFSGGINSLGVLNFIQPNGAKGGEKEDMPRPLRYGQGSIVKRKRKNKNGSVYEWYQIMWYDEYGKRQYKNATNKEDSRRVLSQFNKRSMKKARKSLVTLGQYMREWYDTNRRADCGPVRNQTCTRQMNRIPQEIMDTPLAQVKANDLQKYINSIEQTHPRADTQQLMTAALKHAFNGGLIKANIGELLKIEMPEAKAKEILPREHEERFIRLIPEQYRGYVIGLIYTGTRLSEFFSLNQNWQTDIDYENKIIKIRETKSLRQKDLRAGRTFVYREVPLRPEVAAIKFPLPIIKKQTLNKNFNKALAKLATDGIVLKITPHCMRHTFVSRCSEMNINKNVLKSMTGHKTDKMLYHYTHNTDELLDKEFDRLRESTSISTSIRAGTGTQVDGNE